MTKNKRNSKIKEVSTGAMVAKCLVAALPPSLLPDRFISHKHLAFAVGMAVGFLLQNLIPPIGWRFVPLLLLALAIVGLSFILIH